MYCGTCVSRGLAGMFCIFLALFLLVITPVSTRAESPYNQPINPKIDTKSKLNNDKLDRKEKALLLAMQAYQTAKNGDVDEAIRMLDTSLSLYPQNAAAYSLRAQLLLTQGKHKRATTDLTHAIELEQKADFFYLRSVAWYGQCEVDKACQDMNKSAELGYELTTPVRKYYLLILDLQGNYSSAVDIYKKAIQEGKDKSKFLNGLAWLLATCPEDSIRDGNQAVKNAKAAIAIKKEPNFYDTLAAAYAEVGDFAKAVSMQEKALSWAQLAAPEYVEEFKRHLATFKSGRPWRESRQKCRGVNFNAQYE